MPNADQIRQDQTRSSFQNWVLTIALVVLFIGVGFTAHSWIPRLFQFANANKDTVENVKKLLELLEKPVSWFSALAVFVAKLWKEKKESSQEPSASAVHNQKATHNIIHAGGNVQTGGISAGGNVQTGSVTGAAQRDLIVHGDVVEKKIIEVGQASEPPLRSLNQLRPPRADFQGRKQELGELHAGINSAATAGRAIISGLQGQGGIGKTELALKLAEELAPRYPDAQIYLDLKGVSEKPLSPSEALGHVIRSFHPDA